MPDGGSAGACGAVTRERELMPCDSRYLAPSGREEELRNAHELLVYVFGQLGREPPEYAVKGAHHVYGNQDDRSVMELCSVLRSLSPSRRDGLVYGRPREALCRRLADWWEIHEKADEAHEPTP